MARLKTPALSTAVRPAVVCMLQHAWLCKLCMLHAGCACMGRKAMQGADRVEDAHVRHVAQLAHARKRQAVLPPLLLHAPWRRCATTK